MNDSIAGGTRWPPTVALLMALSLVLSACGGAADGPGGNAQPAAKANAPAAAAATATAASQPGGFDFETWAASNAACKGEYFADVQDAAFPRTLSAAGIEVSANSDIGEVGPGSGTLTPRQPARLHGLAIRHIDYDFGSGSTFAVVVEASAEQARAAVDAKPLPEVYREYYRLGVTTAEPSEDVPMPDIVFVRPGEAPGTQEIGCAAFDM